MSVSHALVELQREIYLEGKSAESPVTQLMPWIVDRRNLEAAWERIRQNDGAKAHGPDGQSVRDWERRKEPLLRELASRLYKGTFHPAAPRTVEIPKPTGGTRTLGVLNVRDRVVHAAIKQVVEPLLDPTFSPDSFGFRPGRSVPAALVAATRLLSANRNELDYVVKLDVEACFDRIDHAILLDRLRDVTSDNDMIGLIQRILATSGKRSGWWRPRSVGVVQGSSLSPLLCNFYLHRLDERLRELGASHAGGVRALRYADDLLVLARGRGLARRALATARQALREGRQRIKAEKLAVTPSTSGCRWLGVDLQPRDSGVNGAFEFAYYVPAEKVEQMLARIGEMTVPPSTRIDPSAFDLGRWLASINEQLRDWWGAYMYAENAQVVFRKLDAFAFERVGELLHSITGLRRRDLYGEYRVRLPRGFQSWQIGGTRMTVLSSLAPRNPERLMHPPAWMRRPRAQRVLARSRVE